MRLRRIHFRFSRFMEVLLKISVLQYLLLIYLIRKELTS
nr:unnamed protein product [Callosobruchus chinensis]